MNDENNRAILCGIVATKPTFSHEIYSENFFEFLLRIKRLSNEEDVISITMSEKLIVENQVDTGKEVCISGQFRSYNKIEDGKSKLLLTVFAKEFLPKEEITNSNYIELDGYICKPTIYRTTPFSREICDVLVAVNRAYNKSDYIPCIAWGRNARLLKDLEVSERLKIVGRIQSRKYNKRLDNGELIEKTAYEVSISKITRQCESDFNQASYEIASAIADE